MMGSEQHPGIIPLTIVELFSTLDKMQQNQFKVMLSYLEVIVFIMVIPGNQIMKQFNVDIQ
jgi:hypothetical protein